MTYLWLNLFVMVLIGLVLVASGQLLKLPRKPLLATLGIILIATAVFDSIIVELGLVTYDTAKILGIYIAAAPLEDFAYALVVVALVPVLWKVNGTRHE